MKNKKDVGMWARPILDSLVFIINQYRFSLTTTPDNKLKTLIKIVNLPKEKRTIYVRYEQFPLQLTCYEKILAMNLAKGTHKCLNLKNSLECDI